MIEIDLTWGHNVIYKYLDDTGAIKSLENGYLFARQPDKFNDPLEWNAILDERITKHIVIDEFQKYPEDVLKIAKGLSQTGIAPPSIDDKNAGIFYEFINDKFKKIVEDFIPSRAVVCFSESNNNNQMWAHYAKEHEGIVIGYNELMISQSHDDLQQVNYVNSPIKFGMGFLQITPDGRLRTDESPLVDSIIRAMTTKHISWSYECEHRIIIEIENHEQAIKDRWKYPVNPEAIKEIIFGHKTSPNTKDKIMEIVKSNHKLNVTYFKATPNRHEYTIDINEIPQ